MLAIVETVAQGPFGNPDTSISEPREPSLRKNARLEEARDICHDLLAGRSLLSVAQDADDLMAYGVGQMVAKLAKNGDVEDEAVAFLTLSRIFTRRSFEGDKAFRFNRRTTFDSLCSLGVLRGNTSIRDAKPAGTLPTIHEISRVIEKTKTIGLDQIQSPARSRDIVHARFIAIWAMRHLCGHSLTYIGEQLGNRDHTSVLNGVNRIRGLRERCAATRDAIDDICDEADMQALRRHHGILVNQPALRRVV